MPSVYRRPLSRPPSRQPLEDAPWARLAEPCSNDHEALLNRERARLQAGLTTHTGGHRGGH